MTRWAGVSDLDLDEDEATMLIPYLPKNFDESIYVARITNGKLVCRIGEANKHEHWSTVSKKKMLEYVANERRKCYDAIGRFDSFEKHVNHLEEKVKNA